MSVSRLPRAFALAVLLLGCSQNSDPAANLPPVARANPGPVSPDGSYDGRMMNNGSSGPEGAMCGSGDTFTLAVRNSRFRMVLKQPEVPYHSQITFDLTIAPDGSFASPPGASYMRGTVGQGHMQGQIVGDACSYDFEADRTGTW